MGKTRSCRRTQEDTTIHEEAVKLRKMTDRQLVEAFHQAQERAARPLEPPETVKAENDKDGVKKLLDGLSAGRCKGIKGATSYKVTEYARELGLI